MVILLNQVGAEVGQAQLPTVIWFYFDQHLLQYIDWYKIQTENLNYSIIWLFDYLRFWLLTQLCVAACIPIISTNRIKKIIILVYCNKVILTLSPTAYQILWLLRGGASEAPPKISKKESSLTPCCYIAFVCLYI